MDPSDFDVDRHVIPFSSSSVTPAKKRMKRNPEQFSPAQVWKPSCRSKRSECDKRLKESTKRFFQCKVDSCVSEDVPCQAAIWLFRALHSACLSTCSDFRMAIETSLEWASIPGISRAILFVLGIDIDLPLEKTACKTEYLRSCIIQCIEIANKYEA